jgi:hypothetical protein
MSRVARALILALLLTVGLGGGGLSAQGQGSPVTTMGFVGGGAFASFRVVEGCIYADTIVGAGNLVITGDDSATQPNGQQAVVGVGVLYRDQCTGTNLFFGNGIATGVDFTLGPKLSWAAVHATVPLTDHISGTTVSVQVDVSWTATGALELFTGADHYIDDDGAFVQFHDLRKSRDATAVGTVTDGTTAFIPAGSSGGAFMSWSRSGQLVIERAG